MNCHAVDLPRGDRQIHTAVGQLVHHLPHGRAVTPLHDEIQSAVLFAELVHAADVRMMNQRSDARFVHEQPLKLRRLTLPADGGLDGDEPLKRRTYQSRGPDATHAALSDGSKQLIATKSVARARTSVSRSSNG